MNLYFKEYSNDIFRGRGRKAWENFGMTQFLKLHQTYGFKITPLLKETLNKHCKYVELKKGTVIVSEGDFLTDVYYLFSGSVKFTQSMENTVYVNRLLSEGNFITSVSSFFNSQPADVKIETLEKCRAFKISKSGLAEIYKGPLSTDYSEFIAKINEEVLNFEKNKSTLLYSNAKSKFELLNIFFPGIFSRFQIKLIASFAGMKPETMSRIRRIYMEMGISLPLFFISPISVLT